MRDENHCRATAELRNEAIWSFRINETFASSLATNRPECPRTLLGKPRRLQNEAKSPIRINKSASAYPLPNPLAIIPRMTRHAALAVLSILAAATLSAQPAARFRAQEIDTKIGVGYAVTIGDINQDGKPDIVLVTPTQVVWFENPSWTRHVIMDGLTKKDNVCISAADINGDGRLAFALGADWQPANTESGGSLQWFGRPPGSSEWSAPVSITNEPTLHRIRFGDVDGDGKPELIVAPLHGRGNKGPLWEGQGSRILVFKIPKDPVRDKWLVEVADDSLHIVHNFIVADYEGKPAIWTASREGVHILTRGRSGKWSRRKIAEGAPGEIKLGSVGGKPALATVEPWHGTSIVLYHEPAGGGLWTRELIDDQLAGGHALGWGDFDRSGSDQLAVGWRDKNFGVVVYSRGADGKWTKRMIDDGGMAAEDLVVADLNGDGRPDIVVAGRKTQNVKIYWNEGIAK